jgi:DNA-binding NtrC family response regulator
MKQNPALFLLNLFHHRILVADDELSMRKFIGYRVSLAKNHKQAVKLIQNNSYDLVLTDIRLKDFTGLDVLKEAKKRTRTRL